MYLKTTIALGFLLAVPAIALAEDAAPAAAPAPAAGKHWAACETELAKFCANIEKGKGKKRACLETHTSELSDGCKTSLAEHAAKDKAAPEK
jgi:hypothetical protein